MLIIRNLNLISVQSWTYLVVSFPNLVKKWEQFNFTGEDEAKVKNYTRANDWI